MIRYLMRRPVGVLMAFAALLITGAALINKVPVNLLPQADVPQIQVRVSYPNVAAAVIEQNCIKLIREVLVNVQGLRNLDSKTTDHTATIELSFEYGTKMDLAAIEVNEKLDRLTTILPKDLPRPLVTRINTSDIPVARIQVIPKDVTQYAEVSELTETIISKRIAQIDGVSMVDINGKKESSISVSADKNALIALQADESLIVQTIRNANREASALSVKDGQYRYFIKIKNKLADVEAIQNLPVLLQDGSVIPLKRIADVQLQEQQPSGYHIYNNNEGLVLTVQEEPGSRMNDLMPRIKQAVNELKAKYPSIHFAITQDQSFLLDAAIDNLVQDLLYGGILTMALLFLFMGNWRLATLMCISIPVSLVITFALFYFFGISFNIISLSGLALGIGMLIDNSIVVLDNITRKQASGSNTLESAVSGTQEVIAPVISQVLTTVAVYAPLVLIGGMAAVLVWEQSIALTLSLSVSLLVAFVLAPSLYKTMHKRSPASIKQDTRFYRAVERGYHSMITYILKHKPAFLLLTLAVMVAGVVLTMQMPVTALPKIEKTETLVTIDWNEPIDARENVHRVKQLCNIIKPKIISSEADAGISQFMLAQNDNTIQKASLYYACRTEPSKLTADALLKQWLQIHYPLAVAAVQDAPNAFTQLFVSNKHYLEARFKPAQRNRNAEDFAGLTTLLQQLPQGSFEPGAGILTVPAYVVDLDHNRMALYGISRTLMDDALRRHFGDYMVSSVRTFGQVRDIYIRSGQTDMEAKLSATVRSYNGNEYPLKNFLTVATGAQPRFITADKAGEYRSIVFGENVKNIDALHKELRQKAMLNNLQVQFTGRYFDDRQQVQTLGYIFLLVLMLLYFILAIQYESLVQPLIVMLTIPLGIAGGMFLLWVSGYSLDVMAAIGFVVILGLIVDDPILKIETLNRLRKEYQQQGLPFDRALQERMIHETGGICLKPLLMVSLTTSIAMVPVLFVGGLGNDLQRPLALVIIGGLTIGTFFTTWFIPIAYWYVSKYANRLKTSAL